MDEPPDDGTDGSSIKPVSSLRSHFENIASTRPSASPVPSRDGSPRARSHQDRTETTNTPPSGRASLDLPSRDPRRKAGQSQQNLESQAALRPPPRDVQATSAARTSGQRPISMVSLSRRASPPILTVNAPEISPLEQNTAATYDSPPKQSKSKPPVPSFHQRNYSAQSPGRSRQNSASPGSSVVDPRKSPFLTAKEAEEIPDDFNGLNDDSATANIRPSPARPFVDRAAKPKMRNLSPSMNVSLDGRSPLTLAPTPSPAEEKLSPFSTPPSSDESPEADFPPALPKTRPAQQPSPSHQPIPNAARCHDPHDRKHHDHRARVMDLGRQKVVEATSHMHGPRAPPASIHSNDAPLLPPRRDASGAESAPPIEARYRDVNGPSPKALVSIPSPVSRTTAEAGLKFPPPPKRAVAGEAPNELRLASASQPPSHPHPPARPPRSEPASVRSVSASAESLPSYRTRDVSIDGPPTYRISDTSQDLSGDIGRSSNDYPDSSQANRRSPWYQEGPKEIPAKFDTRLFCVSGEYVCATGHVTRVWNMATGDNVLSISHGETVKITAVAFKSGANVQREGPRLWLGTSLGEVQEIDVRSQTIVTSSTSAHPRREVIKIFPHGNEMWTLDDEGKLHVWPPDDSGSPNLANIHHSFRLPKGHSFSVVVRQQLWHAIGRDIRVFEPSIKVNVPFQILSQPLRQTGVGDITSGATLAAREQKVIFGHADGKVTIYSPEDYACLGVVNVSLYKINALCGVGDLLWAGFNTGMVYVYDTESMPWRVKKDWHAHEHPLINLWVDQSNLWQLDRLPVASLASDNCIRIWDGLLQDDWLDAEMEEHEAEYCQYREIRTLVMTWNAGASIPQSLRHDEIDNNFFRELLNSEGVPDILVFGFQELVDLEDKKVTAKSFFRGSKKRDASEQEHMSRQYREWRDHLTRCIEEHLPANEPYHLLHTASMVGLFTCIFIRAAERQRIRHVEAAEVKRGMGGLHGNKGALIVRFILDDSSLCFVNCHLAAGQTQTVHRNNDIAAILETAALPIERNVSARTDVFSGGGDGTMILDHEICVLNGDLNYRIDTMGRDTVINAVKTNHLNKLLERDQLLLSRKRNPGFRLRAFMESPITFAPTYKYDVGTDRYDTSDKKRAPAWCDRILYRGLGRIKPLSYRRHEVRVSDHRPVSAAFQMRIKTISPKQRVLVWDQCVRSFADVRRQRAASAESYYLSI